jgi:hypothetical protein
MHSAQTLDAKIGALTAAVGDLQGEVQAALATLRAAGNVAGTLSYLSRVTLLLMRRLFGAAGQQAPSDNLYDYIESAYKQKLLPKELYSSLHTIRTWSNPADHAAEQLTLTRTRAENQLASLVDVIEWFHCECTYGPRLPTIYGVITAPPPAQALQPLALPTPPTPALPKKSVLRLICYRFHALNISILLSILSFWAKPPPGEGELPG